MDAVWEWVTLREKPLRDRDLALAGVVVGMTHLCLVTVRSGRVTWTTECSWMRAETSGDRKGRVHEIGARMCPSCLRAAEMDANRADWRRDCAQVTP